MDRHQIHMDITFGHVEDLFMFRWPCFNLQGHSRASLNRSDLSVYGGGTSVSSENNTSLH